MLCLFSEAGKKNSNNQTYQFWQQDNHPVELTNNKLMEQKLPYIHENPVTEGIVINADQFKYSSAIDYSGGKGLIPIEFIE